MKAAVGVEDVHLKLRVWWILHEQFLIGTVIAYLLRANMNALFQFILLFGGP